MQRSYDVLFASSNKNKYVEVKQILHEHGIKVGFFKFTPVEIQSDALEEIASDKARQASKLVKRTGTIVEDAGLFVDSHYQRAVSTTNAADSESFSKLQPYGNSWERGILTLGMLNRLGYEDSSKTDHHT